MESTSSDDFTRMLAAKMNKRVLNAMHEAKAELGEAGQGIDLSDAGADQEQIVRYWKGGQAPGDFVDWFGEKYDLITRDQWDPFGVAICATRS